MEITDPDIQMRLPAFDRVQKLIQIHERLTTKELNPGFIFEGSRYPLFNPQRGIFKPRQMKCLLSIKTVYPRSGAKIWYDYQRKIHQQVFKGEESVAWSFMGKDPNAADNRWLREAFENQIPIIYFLEVAPGYY